MIMRHHDATHTFGPITDTELRRVGAQRRLAANRERRLIVKAVQAGHSQTLIAKLIGVSQPQVSRTIAAVKQSNDGVLAVEPESALDIIDMRDAGEIDTAQMLKTLSALDYTEGYVPKWDGVATDAYVRGSWDDIEYAYQQDKLTFEEYSELFHAHRHRTAASHGQ